ncbi:MAG TPA: inorganic phosphate transporter [Patescibacteria group bacterium]|nr:inorganic phosphate transporter [Patescibacteria group bacterium]
MTENWIVAAVVLIALIFLLTNGLHDASSVVATFIACGAATPLQAVMWAALLELIGAVLGGSAVAHTIAGLVLLPVDRTLLPLLAAVMIAAMVWNVLTWRLGLPSSSTHALVGGLIGSVWMMAGTEYIFWGWTELWNPGHSVSGIVKVVMGLVVSPLLGFLLAYLLQKLVAFLLRNASFSANRWLKQGQWLIVGLLAFNHGANDTQKVLGLVGLALVAAGQLGEGQPLPVEALFVGGLIMFIGILSGGWPIMKTLGSGIFTLRPIHSFNSQLSAGSALLLANISGMPVSTTHLVAGSVIGAGAADEYRMVNWAVGKEMMVAWCVTIPASALVAAVVYPLLAWLTGL